MKRTLEILWSIVVLAGLVRFGVGDRIWARITLFAREQMLQRSITIPAFLAALFASWAIASLAFDLITRRFALRDWLAALLPRAMMFMVGGSFLMLWQILAPKGWRPTYEVFLLILFLTTNLIDETRSDNRGRRLLATLVAWLWAIAGLNVSMHFLSPKLVGSPLLVAHLSLWMTGWIGIGAAAARFVRPAIADQMFRCAAWCGGLFSCNSCGPCRSSARV